MAHKTILKISTWNSCSLLGKIQQFSQFLKGHEIDIALISETWLTDVNPLKISGYTVYGTPQPTRKGGTAVVIKSYINHSQVAIPQLQEIQATAIKIYLEKRSIYIVAIYIPPKSSTVIADDLRKLTNLGDSLIIGGDFNARHPSWLCRNENILGKTLASFLDRNAHEIMLLHPDTPTYYPPKNRNPSIIDFFILKNMCTNQTAYTVAEMDSDHNPVITQIPTLDEIVQTTQIQSRLNFKKANWKMFKSILNTAIDIPKALKTPEDTNRCIQDFTSCIKDASKAAIPKITNRTMNELPADIIELIKIKNKIRRKWQKRRRRTIKTALNNLINTIGNLIKEYRNQQWEKKLQHVNENSNDVWTTARKFTKKFTRIHFIHSSNNGLVYSASEKANAIADTFEQTHLQNIDMGNDIHEKQVNRLTRHIPSSKDEKIELVKPSEILRIISRLKKSKAPGEDNIQNEIIKSLTRKAIIVITKINNSILINKTYPKIWKTARMIVIPKPGKNPAFPQNLRPISLLNNLSKITEKIIYDRIIKFLEERNCIPEEQYGFRSQHSTQHAINIVTEQILTGFNWRKQTGMVLLDIEKAFDTVWHKGIIAKMIQLNFPRYLIEIIDSYLKNRHFYVSVEGARSISKPIAAGVPQGSLLGPLLFILYTYDIPRTTNTQLVMYADDVAILATSWNANTLTNRLQMHLTMLESYYSKWKIKINVEKTEALIFSKMRKKDPKNTLVLNNKNIPWGTETKYLGVIFDKKLTFATHLKERINSARKMMNMLYPLLKYSSVLNIKNKAKLYMACVRPILTYGSSAWKNVSKKEHMNLQRFQNKCLRTITNLYRNTNDVKYVKTIKLHEVANVPLLRTYTDQTCRTFYDRCQDHKNSTIRKLGQYSAEMSWLNKYKLPNL